MQALQGFLRNAQPLVALSLSGGRLADVPPGPPLGDKEPSSWVHGCRAAQRDHLGLCLHPTVGVPRPAAATYRCPHRQTLMARFTVLVLSIHTPEQVDLYSLCHNQVHTHFLLVTHSMHTCPTSHTLHYNQATVNLMAVSSCLTDAETCSHPTCAPTRLTPSNTLCLSPYSLKGVAGALRKEAPRGEEVVSFRTLQYTPACPHPEWSSLSLSPGMISQSSPPSLNRDPGGYRMVS